MNQNTKQTTTNAAANAAPTAPRSPDHQNPNLSQPNQTQFPIILDNRTQKMAHHLNHHLQNAQTFRIVSAYFSVFGFEALAQQLQANADMQVKFLFGSPDSAADISAGKKAQRTFQITQEGLIPDEIILQQRQHALRCAQWVKRDNVQIRQIAQANFLHGKMYHIQNQHNGTATVGSSNFTRRGLGLTQNPNIEINLATNDTNTLKALAQWFDELWNDPKITTDAKPEMLAALQRWHKEHSPEFIYFKTLFELFRNEIDGINQQDAETKATGLYATQIWQKLYAFQQDGAKIAINRLRQNNGCIIADSVGLGKTYTALAVIKYFENRGENVLVLCPKKLEQNWRIYQSSAHNINNPFTHDRFSYKLLAHTDLSRTAGHSGDIDLATFNWSNFDLIVIDESHNFRNNTKSRQDEHGNIVQHSRYEKLMNDIIKKGVPTKVLMLSATPVNTTLDDLRNQIYLMTEESDNFFAETLGLRNIKGIITDAQKKFQEWTNNLNAAPTNADKGNLLANLGGDFLHLLGGVTIARSRRHIQQTYKEFIALQGDFPKRENPINEHPNPDLRQQLSYEDLCETLKKIRFRIYRPSSYVTAQSAQKRLENEKKEYNFNQLDREKFLIGMMLSNFLKRLESSAHSCQLTLQRTLEKMNTQIARIEKFQNDQQNDQQDAQTQIPDEDDPDYVEDEEFFVNRRVMKPYHLSELNIEQWHADIQADRDALQQALNTVKQITPHRDGKLESLKTQIRTKAKKTNRKLLIFTAFKDTAEYLYQHIEPLAQQLNLNIALVTGTFNRSNCQLNQFADILNHFAPRARELNNPDKQIDIIIATDCISEGQNLQDCDTVINYDIHWNPVRLIQRFGRIDRLGSQNRSVYMINYWPIRDIDVYLKLHDRVRARMALVDIVATGDDDSLNGPAQVNAAQMELNFRDAQLKTLRNEIIDPEDSGNVTISDFTLDQFIAQILRYLERNRAEMENTPPGVYAVTNTAGANPAEQLQDGAIFFFRQRNPGENTTKNPKHPFYLVHVEPATIRHGYANLRDTLTTFQAITNGKKQPLRHIANAFSTQIQTEQGKQFYNQLAKLAVDDTKQAYSQKAIQNLRPGAQRGALIPKQAQLPTDTNLQLLTWLVIKPENKKQ